MQKIRTTLAIQWLRVCLPLQRVQVPSLVKELRSPHAKGCCQKKFFFKMQKDFPISYVK